jgi:hypothetical protein
VQPVPEEEKPPTVISVRVSPPPDPTISSLRSVLEAMLPAQMAIRSFQPRVEASLTDAQHERWSAFVGGHRQLHDDLMALLIELEASPMA